MQRRLRFISIGLVITALCAAAALAQGVGQNGQNPGRKPADRLMKQLGITQEQATRLRAILTEPDEELARLQKAVKVARLRLALAVEEEAAEARLAALIKEYETAAKPLQEYQAARIRKALAVLTVGQQAKLIVMDREDWWRIFQGQRGTAGR